MRLLDGTIPVFGTHDENTLGQLRDVASRAARAALMADGHLGYIMPVGGVAAYDNTASVNGVGFDIACGNAAIRTDARLADFSRPQLETLADDIQRTISFGLGRTNAADDAPVDHPLFEDHAWSVVPGSVDREQLRRKARAQLGTVGSGNHYVDVLADDAGTIWVGVHFGSRGLGHTIASGFLALGQGLKWGERAPEVEVLLPLDTPLGSAYWELMSLAGQYAYAGREWVTRKVVSLLGAHEAELIHNHHNYAWRETHGGVDLIVVRKGATPAWPGQRGFVGGSMGDDAVIVEGVASPASALTLASTVHGAGRVMSRTEAAGKRDRRTGEIKRAGRISPEMMGAWLRERDVILRGGGLDEAPQAYRRLPDVLAEQGETVRVLHTLRPVIVVMAGPKEFDPYKD